MLRTLRVRDLATVADVTLDLGPGLNVLTGETGAGKSMLVDALALLLGDRADRAAVRTGASRAVVEGSFDALPPSLDAALDAAGLDPAELLVIRREVSTEGRSRAWINGSPTTIGIQGEIGARIVDLHGQHQSLDLARSATQRALLDAYADAADLRAAVASAHRDVAVLRDRIVALSSRRDEAVRRSDWLRHVIEEIDAARIQPGEDTDLDIEANRLGQAGILGEQAREILALLDADEEGIRSRLGRLAKVLEQVGRRDPTVEHWRLLLDPAWAACDELARVAEMYEEDVAQDPNRLAQVERRRDLLGSLIRKHGRTLQDVAEVRRTAGIEMDLIDTATLDLSRLDRDLETAMATLERAAANLTARRASAAARLAEEVTRVLPGLGMPEATVSIEMRPLGEIGPEGAEQVIYTAQLNPGLSPRPIATAASGGELSRLMLAMKVALVRHDQVPTLVFDEIDQGIGGETGAAVGAALAGLAARHQVLVITHLPQIAARADRHLVVRKQTRGGIATSDVAVIHGEDRVLEIARMLGSADDEAARRLATSLLAGGVSA
ncbi:MAG: DNA repair protein RecN [Gemmatimonadota bacterium]